MKIRLIRAADLTAARAELDSARAALAALRGTLAETEQHLFDTGDSLLGALETNEALRDDLTAARDDLTAARDDLAHARGELDALRAQQLLDTEDRQALRTLLRVARKQADRADRVYVLLHFGELHSVHATRDAAESAAEAEGAPRDGWTSSTTCCATPSAAAEVPWRIRTLPLGGGQR
ncbi:hypothetical protein ACWDRB_67710 [Nonomuraea sp. NPDC003707]|uniref:hypothetical protein n=1 Tax=unclassified Streptomyces TaxID=2593676 RepID=UPI0034125592